MSDPLDDIKVHYRFTKEEVQALARLLDHECITHHDEDIIKVVKKINDIVYGPDSEK